MPAVVLSFQGVLVWGEEALVLLESPADARVAIPEGLTRQDLSWKWTVSGIHSYFQSSPKGPS